MPPSEQHVNASDLALHRCASGCACRMPQQLARLFTPEQTAALLAGGYVVRVVSLDDLLRGLAS